MKTPKFKWYNHLACSFGLHMWVEHGYWTSSKGIRNAPPLFNTMGARKCIICRKRELTRYGQPI